MGIFSSSESKVRLICSGHSFCGRFNQAGPVSTPFHLSSLMIIALVPTSASLLTPLTSFQYGKNQLYPVSQLLDWPQTLDVNNESCVSNAKHLLIMTTKCLCCLRSLFLDYLFYLFNLTEITAACSSNRSNKRGLIRATLS